MKTSRGHYARVAEPQAEERSCDHPDCAHVGQYRAPKSRDALHEYYWFCLEHVRAYNAAWDYYAGCSTEEIESMLRRDVTWQRPTWPLGSRFASRCRIDPSRLKDYFGIFEEAPRNGGAGANGREAGRTQPGTPEGKAMKLMSLQEPLTVALVKARYKELVKLHHPDANGGSKAAEERFKEINQAYKTLMGCLNP